ncbi:NOP5/NOP56 family protein [Halostella litorea]|uniref:NOP5/NOP56 family protein n=1 Tax=Halostella litorea TaxID=2528831 RepID=UPI0010923244|nr:NOP5/NOP56 family protein [Halostella litorea]
MTDGSTDAGWFRDVDPGDPEAARDAIENGSAATPDDWPALAVEAGVAADEAEYYDRLRDATLSATAAAVETAERADDRQLAHAVRAMDDCERTANELAERVAEWAGTLFEDAEAGVDGALALVEREPDGPAERRVVGLAERVAGLIDERDALREYVERQAGVVAPNLAALGGPVLAARLIALAGGLESLAKMPSGTVQVLGAEDALFAHLRGRASSPKHGIIYTHEYVRGTAPDERGSASRALAGKLTIAARVDHYSGERKPELDEQLDERIRTIRARGDGE